MKLIRQAKSDQSLRPEPGFITWHDSNRRAISGVTSYNVQHDLHRASEAGLESVGRYYYTVSYLDQLFTDTTRRGSGR